MTKRRYHHGDLPTVLLEAAEAELAEHGLERFSLRAVAKRAEVSHAAPAHHFKDLNGLLTALAARGYERLVQFQQRRQKMAGSEPRSQAVASGLGYIDFAVAHPALFRLMFASERPDRADTHFAAASLAAFDKLVVEIQAVAGSDPYANPEAMIQLIAAWSVVHGLAELIVSGRAERPLGLEGLSTEQRDAVLSDILRRVNRP
ncbi:MAG: TetR/AcrR family transcriptional regulator [Wenzhouxiangellaceae bacterium]